MQNKQQQKAQAKAQAKVKALQAQIAQATAMAENVGKLNTQQLAGLKAQQYACAFGRHMLAVANNGASNQQKQELLQALEKLQEILNMYNGIIALPQAMQKSIPRK